MKTKTCIFAIYLAAGLSNSHAQDTWTKKADFGGTAREWAVGFSVGGKGYLGTGYDGSVSTNDFWEYDPSTNVWTQKASMDGARKEAFGFSIGSKGYIGMGQLDGVGYANDFWEYDPSTNVWTQKSNFGGVPRHQPAGFSIGSKGYVGTGWDGSYHKDFWEYDPSIDTWIQKADFPGSARAGAVGFSIGNSGYIGTGQGPYGFYNNDFWEYDPITNAWIRKANFGGTARDQAKGFSIGSKGYIGPGSQADSNYQDLWEYDPATNTWVQKADFGGAARTAAIGFSIGSKGYIGTGALGTTVYKDFWEYSTDGGNSGTCLPPPPGLVSWWSGDKTAADVQGTNPGVLKNGASFRPGQVGPGFVFDGTDDYVAIPDSSSLNPPDAITLDAWVYWTGHPGNVIAKDGEVFDRQYKIGAGGQVPGPFFRAHIGVPSGFQFVDGATLLVSGTWYHVAETYDGSFLKLYVNGALDGSIPVTGPIITTTQPVHIGGVPYYIRGIIDEAQIFNRALTDAEILVIYQAGADGQCKPNIFVSSITPSYEVRGRQYLISTAVVIQDVNGVGIEDATTAIKTTFPDRSVLTFPAITDKTGQATISFYSTAPGRYQFKVQRVSHPTRVYDASLNVETSDTLVIP